MVTAQRIRGVGAALLTTAGGDITAWTVKKDGRSIGQMRIEREGAFGTTGNWIGTWIPGDGSPREKTKAFANPEDVLKPLTRLTEAQVGSKLTFTRRGKKPPPFARSSFTRGKRGL